MTPHFKFTPKTVTMRLFCSLIASLAPTDELSRTGVYGSTFINQVTLMELTSPLCDQA